MAANERSTGRAAEQKRLERSSLPSVRSKGQRISFHEDLYPFILRLSWSSFFAFLIAAFVLTNVAFAGLYMVVPRSIAHAETFLDHFFFSVETLATIGYGEMAPQNHWAHAIVAVEAFAGIATTAMITGLIFVRFARPTAQILFTDKMTIAPRDGVPHLVFRMANQRQNQISDAQVNVIVLVTEVTQEGEMLRHPRRLELVRDRNPMFALTWSAMHRIDEKSPFYGDDAIAKLTERNAEIFVSLTGFDETLMQTITARWRYQLDHIVRNARFADVLTRADDGTRIVDYDKFHEVVPLEAK